MSGLQTGPLARFVRGLAPSSAKDSATDRELLHRFAGRRDEAAFAALVHRHGAMVLRVAQRVLQQKQDAEDVFQATFLVLARKAELSLWRDSLANWLYEAAYRLACEARSAGSRRRDKEMKVPVRFASDPLADISLREALQVLDEEMIRLPARLRMPIIMCCLEAVTQEEAARKLGWSLATFKRRLVRGRALLQARLTGRGLTLAVLLAALEVSRGTSSAAAVSSLVGTTMRAALTFTDGRTVTGPESHRAALLAQKLLSSLLLTKVKLVATLILLCTCGVGVGIGWRQRGPVNPANPVEEKGPVVAKSIQPPRSTKAPSTEETIAALKAGLEQWRKDVQFRSTFKLSRGYATSVEAGLRDGVDPSIKEPAEGVSQANGVFHQMGELARHSIDFGQPPIPVQPRPDLPPLGPGQSMVRNSSWDEITTSKILVRYHPRGSGNHVGVLNLREGPATLSNFELSPLNPHRNPRFQPFELWQLEKELPPKAVIRNVRVVDKEHTEVVLSQDGSRKQFRRVLLRTSAPRAVITAIDDVINRSDGKTTESHIRLSDFRECPGGLVARRVLTVSKLADGRVMVEDWISQDLGDTPPAIADFLLLIAPDTGVSGYRKSPPRGGIGRRIDITTIDEADVDHGVR